MKTIRIIVALFALFIALKGGTAIIFPGDNILVIKGVQGIVYDYQGQEIQKIPMDLIQGIGAINDKEIQPEVEM
jgi:hypothetical protein